MHGRGGAAPPLLLIVAGAGSGKTLTLAARVARLVLDGADPQRMLLLTFSRRAAREMAPRRPLLHRRWACRHAARAAAALGRHFPRRRRAAAARIRAAHRPGAELHASPTAATPKT